MTQLPGTTGYLSAQYAEALAGFGRPRSLPRSGGWILERPIAGTGLGDAMGLYPLLACRDWEGLAEDVEEPGDGLVSLVAVADPLGSHRPDLLARCFPDLARPFKRHFIVETGAPLASFVAAHHQRNARKALAALDVGRAGPEAVAEEWVALYSNLIARHGIRGLAAFSSESLRRQLEVPGAAIFSARFEGEVVGIALWYEHGGAAYYHLGAYSEAGYRLRASFALFWHALEHFTEARLERLDLGAGAGLEENAEDGLTRFKRGWSTGTRDAWLCGRVFDRAAYDGLAGARAAGLSDYFPAYRKGEFG